MTHIQQGVALGYARIHLCGVVPDHAPAGRLGPTSETPYAVSDLQRRQIDVFYLGVVDERNIERPVAHDQFHNFITFSYEQTLPGARHSTDFEAAFPAQNVHGIRYVPRVSSYHFLHRPSVRDFLGEKHREKIRFLSLSCRKVPSFLSGLICF